jgi:2-polyprenyl-6-methoxyphenol hydroxylase-like FAD-dependent oxidoreductase
MAADGARSAVRRSLGVEFEGFTYAELFLIASTDFPFENTLTDIAYVNYIADPLEWLVLLRVPGLWRVLVPAPENSDRDGCFRMTITGHAAARGANPTRSRIARSITCSAGGEKLPRSRCCRRRGMSTIRSAAWA